MRQHFKIEWMLKLRRRLRYSWIWRVLSVYFFRIIAQDHFKSILQYNLVIDMDVWFLEQMRFVYRRTVQVNSQRDRAVKADVNYGRHTV